MKAMSAEISRTPAPTWQRRLALLLAGGALVILVLSVLPFADDLFTAPYRPGEQARNLQLADEHAAKLQPTLDADPRFRGVRLTHYTGEGGCLAAVGTVASAADLRDLQRLVIASRPPTKVIFTEVFVEPSNPK
jgi:ferric-dicitrate binding protein FerR (iron transport regulator)